VGKSRSKWHDIFDDPKVQIGLVVNERFLNVPDALVPHLHLYLYDEIQKASTENPSFRFNYYLLLTSCYYEELDTFETDSHKPKSTETKEDSQTPLKSPVHSKRKRKKQKIATSSLSAKRSYFKFEEKYYTKVSDNTPLRHNLNKHLTMPL
jgi:hypothetical protein